MEQHCDDILKSIDLYTRQRKEIYDSHTEANITNMEAALYNERENTVIIELEKTRLELKKKFLQAEIDEMTEYNTLRSRQMERKREILNNEKKLAFLKLDALELEIDNFHGSTQQQQKRRRSPPPLTNQQQQQQQQPYIMPDIPLTNYRHDQRGPMNPLPYHNDYRPNNNNNSQRQRSPLRRNTNIRNNNNNNNNNNARNLNNTGRDRDGKRPLQDVFPTQNDHNKKARINEHEEPVITRTIENENFTQPENQILLTPSSPKKNTPRYKSHSSSSSSSSCSSHDELGDYY